MIKLGSFLLFFVALSLSGSLNAFAAETGASGMIPIMNSSGRAKFFQGSNSNMNLGLAASVGSNALTISIRTANGNTPTSAAPAFVSFRNSTSSTGQYAVVPVVASTTLVISSGSTLGHINNVADTINVFAINNSGTVELAASSGLLPMSGDLVTTVAEGGAGAADSRYVMYSTTLRSSVPVKFLGRIYISEATAGTWASAPTRIDVNQNAENALLHSKMSVGELRIETAQMSYSAGTPIVATAAGPETDWISSITDGGVGNYTINIRSGVFSSAPLACGGTASGGGSNFVSVGSLGSSSVNFVVFDPAGAGIDAGSNIYCIGPR